MSFANKVGKMRDIFESMGDTVDKRITGFGAKMDEVLCGDKPLMKPEDFSVKEIFEAVPASAFPYITGKLISKKVMDAYNLQSTVGDSLVETMRSSLMVDRITGITATGDMKVVAAGQPYQHTGALGEKWVQVTGEKYGKILDILEETIMFDQTGQILNRASQIGKGAAMFREKIIMNTIQDIAGYYAWYPSGSRVQLYNDATTAPHTLDNLITNALVNHTDINEALVLLAKMTDENGDPIAINPSTLLVPVALLMTAKSIFNSTVIIGGANSQPNPFAGMFTPVASPFLDAQSAIIWYLGDFKSQFIWKEVIPLQVLTRNDSTNDAAWENDVKAQFKVRFYGAAAATDYRYVVKSTGAV